MENKAARFDLTLLMEENEQGLKGSLEYNSYLFERVSMEQMMASFQIMLEALVADPDQHIWDLPLLAVSPVAPQEESAFSASASPMPHIQELFARQAMRTPAVPALVYKGEQLTYQELNQRANQVARQLLLLGVQPHMHVGLALERSLDLVVGLLGILKVAGVYVPLEVPSACGDVLKDAHIQYVVTRQELATHFQTHAITCLCLETLESVAAPTQETIAENAIDADSILAILYQESTPSTALPACIYQNNEQISTFLNYARQQGWESAAGSVWSSLSSALFLYELLLPLTTGGAAHLVPEQMCLQGLAYSAWLAEHEISSAYVPMSLLPDLLAWTRQGQPSHLRLLLTQAPAFPEQQLLALQQALPHTRIINGYGTPEVAPWATLYEVRASTGPRRCTPVGSPIDDTQLFLLDQYMHPVPRGVIGEIYLAGTQAARDSYAGSAAMAERFLVSPFDTRGEHLYKTGDYARYLPDGNLELFGRTRQFGEIQGLRIWPDEIAAVLMAHPDVHQAVVLARENVPGNKRLVAYVVPEAEAEVARVRTNLQSFIKEQLPTACAPSVLVILENMPLDRHGMVLSTALPESDGEQMDGPSLKAAPGSKLESDIAAVWRQILKIEHVGVEDNFFDRGGHSLLMIRLHNELQSSLQLDISILDLFKYPTISSLAKYIQQEQPEQQLQAEARQIYSRTDRQKEALQRQKMLMKERRKSYGTQ